MILYFADREMKILGQASTELPKGFIITDDLKTEEVETGVAVFSCYVSYKNENQLKLKEMCKAGNYLIRCNGEEQDFFTIIDSEKDTKAQEFYIYAEDAGLDLLNEVIGEFEATAPQTADWYILQLAADAGFEIGINEIPENRVRQLKFESESTATKRIAEIAAAFGGFEVSFSFKIEGLAVAHKYINIHEERGSDTSIPLRLNKELDRIVTKETISNLATELVCEGGTPEDKDDPITLEGYSYDDGDFYTDGKSIKSRNALAKWERLNGGHIAKPFSCEAMTQAELCTEAIAKLKTICDSEINLEVDINRLPESVKIGDRVNVIDDLGEQYFSTRVLLLENSVTKKRHKATLGETLIKTDGISQKVKNLAAQFAKQTVSVTRAKQIANNAKAEAQAAQTQANAAAKEAENAVKVSEEAKTAANTATQSAANAQAKAEAAEAAANKVENSVTSLETTISNAQAAANNAQQAADTAQTKAEEAETAANNAQKEATEAKEAAGAAQSSAATAIEKAETAQGTANIAKTEAEAAIATAAAAKIDAEQAEADIAEFAGNLETLEETMSAEYARKTQLTEATANLQTQISKNAAELSSTASKLTIIDETVNNAADRVEAAQNAATLAQEQADEASEKAAATQAAANEAKAAAEAAQAEADTAKAAAVTARSVLDQAEAELNAAKIELETISAKAETTEAEIAAAQNAVNTAQNAVVIAKANATEAKEKAVIAQNTANTAVINAENAQQAANKAAEEAELAQQIADEAKGNAEEAQAKADEAVVLAQAAQETANAARATADSAQNTANNARADAEAAQVKADEAAEVLSKANLTLNSATERLNAVLENTEATEEEIAEAQAVVDAAQTAADEAAINAANAQTAADNAKADAEEAQAKADEAKAAADEAQRAAQEAQTLADKAQGAVAGLFKRITKAETSITQNSEQIALRATKEEVKQTLGGYYTKTETDAALTVKSDEINSTVRTEIESIKIGGRNLIANSADPIETTSPADYGYQYITYIPTVLPLDEGQPYTVSANIEVLAGNVSIISVKLYDDNLQTQYAEILPTIKNGRIEGTFEAVNAEATRLLIYAGIAGSTNGNSVKVSKIKFEKGIFATDWTAAPEDVAADIDETATNANDALTRLEAAETQIRQLTDNISMLVQKGDKSSQMVFDENSSTWSFDTGEIDGNISQHTTDIEALKTGATETSESVESVKNRLDNFEEHISIGTYEDEPCLTLYEEDSNYKQRITNTRRIITEEVDGVETVKSKVDIDTAQHKKVIADETLQVGGFAWKKRGTNRIALVWEGNIE